MSLKPEREEDQAEPDIPADDDQGKHGVKRSPFQDNFVGDMGNILSGKASFYGTFSFYRGYTDAPNPMLNLTGLGAVGVPLSTRDTEAVKSISLKPPFGKGERTLTDKSIRDRDTWEMDAKDVHIRSPVWERWLKNVVQVVCTALGADHATSRPRCELHKLQLCETGSRLFHEPHVDTEEADGKFAAIMVVLPSEFTGGAVHLSHGDLSTVYDYSFKGLFATTVVAWHTDIMPEIKPITGGSCLALSFNLIHTATSPRPALLDSSGVVKRLRRVLLSWKQAKGEHVPNKIVYLLKHRYPLANSNTGAMKGRDAQVVGILDMLAQQHGFHLGLAMDLEGCVMQSRLDFDQEKEAIPSNLSSVLESCKHYEQECMDRSDDSIDASLSLGRSYRRTVLVIWPDANNHDMMSGAEGFHYACKKIRTTTSMKPTPDETKLMDYILSETSASSCSEAMRSICFAACVWQDLSVWIRAIKACDAERGISVLGEVNEGPIDIRFRGPQGDNALARDPSNPARFKWLDSFENWVMKQRSTELSSATADWISQQRAQVIRTLKQPRGEEYELLLDISRTQGGLLFLENSILPQIKALSGPWFLCRFADYLHREGGRFEAPELCGRIIRDLLLTVAERVDFYHPVSHKEHTSPAGIYHHSTPSESPVHLSRAQLFFKTCLSTDNDDLLVDGIDKMTNTPGVATEVMQKRAKEVLLPLVASLTDAVRARAADRPVPQFKKLCDTAVSSYVDLIMGDPGMITEEGIANMLQALILAGQPHLVISSIAPKLEALPLDPRRLQILSEGLYTKRKELSPPDGSEVQDIVNRLVRRYAEEVDPHDSSSRSSNFACSANHDSKSHKPNPEDHIVCLLDWCLCVEGDNGCSVLLDRVMDSPRLNDDYKIVEPLISCLPKLAAQHEQHITSPAFAAMFKKIMLTWIDVVMGPKPADPAAQVATLRDWTCNCRECKPTWLRIGFPARKHIEDFLKVHARGAATWETVRTCTPQGMTVSKTNTMYLPVRWLLNQRKGANILTSISTDPGQLRTILGAEYKRVLATLKARMGSMTAASQEGSGSGVASAGVGQGPPTPALSSTITPVPVRPPLASTRSSTQNDEEPPKKRQKMAYDEDDVVDLT
ncbi:hypothetical protein B0H21DRAFT_831190 [Amylocystis lapponica]|nr:hypothetical protein B0H21DRAFT_831190 [Amylocystis lapponica]